MRKIIILTSVLLLLIFAALFLYPKQDVKISTPSQEPIYEVYGKYLTYDAISKDDSSNPVAETCSALVVFGGDDYIITKYKDRVGNGNRVNQVDRGGRLILNFKLDNLNADQKKLLTDGTTTIALQIKKRNSMDEDGFSCGSFVEIISIKPYTVPITTDASESGLRSAVTVTGPNEPIPSLDCPEGQVPIAVAGLTETRTWCALMPPEEYFVGTGKETYEITGYYSPYEIVKYPLDYDKQRDPLPATTTCSAIAVTGGDTTLIDAFKALVMRGNGINKIKDDKLILNIDIEELSQADDILISNFFQKKSINFSVKSKVAAGKDANYCESLIRIISIK